MAPGLCFTRPVTPSLPLPPIPAGQLTDSPFPTFDCQSGLTADRYVVKMFVVPLPSERCATRIAWLGKFTPGLSALIPGSCQFLIVPRKIPDKVLPLSF